MSAPSVREAVFALLREAGMTTVFGNPGSTELRFLQSWPDDFRYVTALHEGCCVAMADAYAQLTRNAAFVNLHSAGGLGNAMGSVFSAYKNQTPLVITAGQQTRAMLPSTPFLYAQDATLLPQPYVKWSCEPARAEDVPAAIERAYHVALQPPFGPTFVSIPEDDWERACESRPLRKIDARFCASRAAVDAILEALRAASRPVFVVGPGVDRDAASDSAVALAEETGAAVFVAPFSSRCSFPERHPNFAGFLPPVRAQIVELLRPYDLVLVLGAPIFTYHVFTPGPPIADDTNVIHLSDDPSAVASAVAGTSILTTLREPLEEIVARLRSEPLDRPEQRGWRSLELRADAPPKLEVAASQKRRIAREAPVVFSGSEPVTAAFALHAIARVLPHDAIIFEEAPSHRNALHEYLPIGRPGTFFAAASGSLGWALPAAVGGALARPGQRIVAILGDGSSMYAIQGLWTAARFALPITFVILNNGSYAAMDQFSRYFGLTGAPSFALDGLDFVRAGQAFGVSGARVDRADALEAKLIESFVANTPALIDVAVDDAASVIY